MFCCALVVVSEPQVIVYDLALESVHVLPLSPGHTKLLVVIVAVAAGGAAAVDVDVDDDAPPF